MDFIWFTFQKEGIHCYPAAATDPELEEVKFLANDHRHIFHFKVFVEIFHDNRDKEWIKEKRYCESLFNNNFLELDYKSCEMLARNLFDKVKDRYENRGVIIEVSEDGENGARLEFF